MISLAQGKRKFLFTFSYVPIIQISVNAWLWSAVFHTRDLLWTEVDHKFLLAYSLIISVYLFVYYFINLFLIIKLFHFYFIYLATGLFWGSLSHFSIYIHILCKVGK